MLRRPLMHLAMAVALMPIAATRTLAAPNLKVHAVAFAQPEQFGLGGDDAGPVSPAGCAISTIETPHVSTYSQVMRQVREVKGNVQATCGHAVDELTLSVSILDADTHQLLVKGAPTKNQRERSLRSNSTAVPCINTKTTRYVVAALGTSYEEGKIYSQVKFSAIGVAACGHA